MNCMRTPNGLRSRFGEADETNFALFHENTHRAHSLFDWRIRIDTMKIVEIYCVDAKAPQTSFARRTNIFRPAVDAPKVRVCRIPDNAEFCREDYFFPFAFDGFADKFFVLLWLYISAVSRKVTPTSIAR